MRVFVLAENYNAYLDWCSLRQVNPRAAECVTNPATLRGRMKRDDQLFDARKMKQDLPQRQVA
jgi:hypothetical protein